MTGDLSPESIGAVRMLEDGTLEVWLRAEGPGGLVGDAFPVLRPGDADYQKWLKHVGGIAPGQQKLVPPWPLEPEEDPD